MNFDLLMKPVRLPSLPVEVPTAVHCPGARARHLRPFVHQPPLRHPPTMSSNLYQLYRP